ncbi:VQ motif-containing protein 22 [Carica papaya]|uniref:VQ motif-containing protein 22 n=1 Tax=Carica papaya TaxID=3649 RepID=UPI000B8C9863|nr:VQ motif-containing protein 22 [Carica papaya]
MSKTMSNPNDWAAQFYQLQNFSTTQPGRLASGMMFGDRVSDATAVTTTVTSSSLPSPQGSGPSNSSTTSSSPHLRPEGRVSRPMRRRTRASRRTPTTLLNTDTTNFRAMVQQFTGGPSAPFASGGPGFSFGMAPRTTLQTHIGNPSAASITAPPPGGSAGYHLQLQYPYQLQQQQQQHHHSQAYMFSVGSNSNTNNNNNNLGGGSEDLFLQRLGGGGTIPNPNQNQRAGMEMVVSDGLVMEVVSTQVPTSRNASAANENTFLF